MRRMGRVFLVFSALVASASMAMAVSVTFNVNMNVQTFRGNFDPSTDQVCVRGNLNDWGQWGSGVDFILSDADEDGIYSGTLNDPGTGHREYKYVVRLDGDGGNIIDPLIQRSYEIDDDSPIALPVVYFADDDGSGEAVDIEVAFTVNMAVQLLQGSFDPETDLIVLRGDTVPLQWGGATNPMEVDSEDSTLYHLELQFDSVILGDDIQYKFVIVRNWETNPSDLWELPDPSHTRAGNRYYDITGTEEDTDDDGYGNVVLDPVYWGDIDFSQVTDHDVTVTYSLDTRPAYLKWADPDSFIVDIQNGDVLVDPITSFQIAGDFNDWPWGVFTENDTLWDDGANGDATAADSFFTYVHVFPAGSVFDQGYKYAINGLDAEGRYGHDHHFSLSNDVTEMTVVDTLGTTDHLYDTWILMLYPDYNDVREGATPELPSAFRVEQNYPNPFNPSTTIGFDLPALAPVSVTVFDIQGREVYRKAYGSLRAGHYSMVFEAHNVASGVYFYRVDAGAWSSTRKMLLVK